MGEGFLKFKRRLTCHCALLWLAVALSVGLVAFGVLYALIRQRVIGLEIPTAIAAVAVGAVGLFLVGFFISKPNDLTAAKRMDAELGLSEKAQTMVEYSNDTHDMAALQRENTEAVLKGRSVKEIKFKRIGACALAVLLAASLFTGAMFVPQKPAPGEPPFDMTEWQATSLMDLIEYVEASEMQTEPKAYTVERLNSLLEALYETKEQSLMQTHVVDTAVLIDAKVDAVNSYTWIVKQLKKQENEGAKEFAEVLAILRSSPSAQAFGEFSALASYDAFAEFVPAFVSAVSGAIESAQVAENDALAEKIVAFTDALDVLCDGMQSYDEQTFDAVLNGEDGVGGILGDYAAILHDEIAKQQKNATVCKYVIAELLYIFGLDASVLPDLDGEADDTVNSPENGEDGDDPSSPGGGIGTGTTQGGSNEQIFDPEKGSVDYNEVKSKYYEQMLELLREGNVPAEIEEFLRDYFATLYDGSGNL